MIVDEAHSSQTGEAAKDLQAGARRRLERGRAHGGRGRRTPRRPSAATAEDCARAPAAARGQQPNLSFFAFTATPKATTLELFGTPRPGDGAATSRSTCTRCARRSRRASSSTCSPTTRPTRRTSSIEKAMPRRPRVRPGEGEARRSPRFVTLHPHNLAQKAEIDRRALPPARRAPKIGGQAKAMVVTARRLHAVRYKQALDTLHRRARATPTCACSSRSPARSIDDGRRVHRADDERLPRVADGRASSTTRRLPGPRRRREVPDRLRPAAAVRHVRRQGADRAERRADAVPAQPHPPGQGRHVRPRLPQRRRRRSRRRSSPTTTRPSPPRPTRTCSTTPATTSTPFDVLRADEVENGCPAARLARERARPRRKSTRCSTPPSTASRPSTRSEQDEFRDALRRFVHIYAFLSQIVSFADTDLERDYLYARALASLLPGSRRRSASTSAARSS